MARGLKLPNVPVTIGGAAAWLMYFLQEISLLIAKNFGLECLGLECAGAALQPGYWCVLSTTSI